jgi:hypothetical protein
MILSGPGRTTRAVLTFSGDDLDPDDVSVALGLIPSTAWRRGDRMPTGRAYTFGRWTRAFEVLDGAATDEVLARILDELEPIGEAVASNATAHFGEIVLSVRAEYFHVGIGFDSGLLGRLHALSLGIDIGVLVEPDPLVFNESAT